MKSHYIIDPEQLRDLTARSRLNLEDLRNGKFTNEQWAKRMEDRRVAHIMENCALRSVHNAERGERTALVMDLNAFDPEVELPEGLSETELSVFQYLSMGGIIPTVTTNCDGKHSLIIEW